MMKPIYSKINYEDLQVSNKPSPTLVFHKWQAYDWDEGNNYPWQKFETKNTRLEFLKIVSELVQSANEDNHSANENHNYKKWFDQYKNQIKAIGAINFEKEFQTNWRLLVGWGTNPTLETGIQLHHLYGFPYIPGSAVKGMLHHLAELELCENINWKIEEESPEEEALDKLGIFQDILPRAELVRILFGSLFIQKHENIHGLDTPLEWLMIWEEKLKEKREYEELHKRIINLISADHTGGMLIFFDAVPTPDFFNGEAILQTDILNPHYQKYYQDEKGEVPPSDDQDPNPVYFLAVRPGVKFVFPFRIVDFPVGEGRDDPEKERAKVLRFFTQQQIKDKVNGWLQKALTEWGAGAKTAAGYGYFISPEQQGQPAKIIDSESSEKKIEDYSETVALEPQPFQSNIRPETKLSGISKQYNQEIWKKVSQSAYIKKIEGIDLTGKAIDLPLPRFSFEKKDNQLKVIYKHGDLNCTVLIKLQGIQSKEEAKYVWDQVIKPELVTQE